MSDELSTCDCCALPSDAPVHTNHPGLSQIVYRVATQPTALARMIALLGSAEASALAGLTTRRRDDPAIAMLDAFAVIADVLSFYSERIANEGYLRTATERRSLLWLAREIGYELRPGVAASAYLAFNVEDRLTSAAGATRPLLQATVPAGSAVQSIPTQGELPQTFETSAELFAKADWNQLKPQQTQPQTLDVDATQLVLAGTTTGLKVGDLLLLVADDRGSVTDEPKIVRVKAIQPSTDANTTTVDLLRFDHDTGLPVASSGPAWGEIGLTEIELSGDAIAANIVGQSWTDAEFSTFMSIQGWPLEQVLANIFEPPWSPPSAPSATVDPPASGVFALRTEAAAFGHNAPNSATFDPDKGWDGTTGNPRTVVTDSKGDVRPGDVVYLDGRYPKITPGSWVTFVNTTDGFSAPASFWLQETRDLSAADFAVSGPVTSLEMAAVKTPLSDLETAHWGFRTTAIYAQSELLPLADVPRTDLISGGSIDLDTLVPGLDGRQIVVTGERSDLTGVTVSEAATVDHSVHNSGLTTLNLTAQLTYSYVRSTVTIAANVVQSTHGETVDEEVLGSSDGSANQRFKLRKPPLTYTSASVPGGAQSTLEVWVSGVKWKEAPSLYGLGPTSREYIVRRDDDGTVWVVFGDGIKGARPASGAENVKAKYRSGIGKPGLVGAGTLTLLKKRPVGIRDVVNPIVATGAADPESRDDARRNAPLTVLTLDRIVSGGDYGAFASAFAGIGKAVATPLWLGQDHVVHITVAGVDGAQVAESPDLENLVAAIEAAHDPGRKFIVGNYTRLYFDVTADLLIDPDLDAATVISNVKAALAGAFSFARRDFGTSVAHSDVIATVLGVNGVLDMNLTRLATVDDQTTTVADLLVAMPARLHTPGDPKSAIDPAQLLLLSPAGATIQERSGDS